MPLNLNKSIYFVYSLIFLFSNGLFFLIICIVYPLIKFFDFVFFEIIIDVRINILCHNGFVFLFFQNS